MKKKQSNEKDIPIYPISIAAKKLGISTDRLRVYEKEGLIKPHRHDKKTPKQLGARRLYTDNDIEYLKCIRLFIENGINIKSLKIILDLTSCSDLLKRLNISSDDCKKCPYE